MVKEIYLCEACNFVYKDKETAEKCEKFCEENKSCNLEITKDSIGELRV